jgi:DNA-binding GntR family transcriptional regulator
MTQNALANDDGLLLVARSSLTLRERAVDILRQAIIDHRFPPGTHLRERELCDLLGISRTSLREALRHLESERLIETVPHKGPVVVALTAQDAKDLYQVRAALEGLVGGLFAANATARHIEDLRQVAEEMSVSAHKDDAKTVLDIVAKFYQVLFDGSGNQICAQFIQSLNTRIYTFRRMSLASEGRADAMMKEVERIVDAATRRDGDALGKACIAHVEAAGAAVMRQMSADAEASKRTNQT